jgi:hypothetical protein
MSYRGQFGKMSDLMGNTLPVRNVDDVCIRLDDEWSFTVIGWNGWPVRYELQPEEAE